MPDIMVKIHAKDGITTEIEGVEAQASQQVIDAIIQQAPANSFVANTLLQGAKMRLDGE